MRDIWEDDSRGMATIVRNCSVVKGRYVRGGSLHGQILDSEGHWAKKRIFFGCKVLGAAVSAAERFGVQGDQLIAVQIHESDASRTCEDSGRWESEAVVESTFTRTLEDSAVFGGSGSEENWMAEGDAAG